MPRRAMLPARGSETLRGERDAASLRPREAFSLRR